MLKGPLHRRTAARELKVAARQAVIEPRGESARITGVWIKSKDAMTRTHPRR